MATEHGMAALSDSSDSLIEKTEGDVSTDTTLEESSDTGNLQKRRHHRSSKHRHSHRTYHWSRRSKLLFALLAIAILATFLSMLFLGIWVYGLRKENSQLKTDLLESQHKLAGIIPETEKLREDLETLLQGRLPGLKRIEFDRVLNLNDMYIKNIIFSEFHSRNETGHEFKIVLYNNTLQTVWPDFVIFFFDSHGLQVRSVKVGAGNKLNYDIHIDPLAPGEIRSHASGVTSTDNNALPAFFMLRLNAHKEEAPTKDR